MTSITGDINYGETIGAGRVISQRLTGSFWLPQIIFFAVVMGGVLGLPILLGLLLPRSLAWLNFPIILIYLGGSWWAFARISRRRLRRAWESRGIGGPFPTVFTLEDDVFVVTSETSETRIAWRAISEIVQTKTHWIFIAAGLGYCLPRRFFGDVESEKAFVASALARIAQAGQTRSRKAALFVGGGS